MPMSFTWNNHEVRVQLGHAMAATIPASNAAPPRGIFGNQAAADEPGCCSSTRPCSPSTRPLRSAELPGLQMAAPSPIDLRQEHTSIPANNRPTIIRGELSVGDATHGLGASSFHVKQKRRGPDACPYLDPRFVEGEEEVRLEHDGGVARH